MINPPWAHAVSVAGERHRITLERNGVPVTVDLLGGTTIAVVQSEKSREDIARPGDIIWVKAVEANRITDDQLFLEGLPGAARSVERIALVEMGKSRALATSSRKLADDLLQLLKAGDDRDLPTLFKPHILLLDLFVQNHEVFPVLHEKDPQHVKRMLERCLTLCDRAGKRNPHSKVLGVKSAQQTLRSMSERRMHTGQDALVQSITLNTLMNAIHALISEVRAEVWSKVGADTWSVQKQNGRWLRTFSERLVGWIEELENVDMQPFRKDAKEVREKLLIASNLIATALRKRADSGLKEAKALLEATVTLLDRIEARFQIADALRVVGTAKDERVIRLGLTVKEPAWEDIEQAILNANARWNLVRERRVERTPITYYNLLRVIANHYDISRISS